MTPFTLLGLLINLCKVAPWIAGTCMFILMIRDILITKAVLSEFEILRQYAAQVHDAVGRNDYYTADILMRSQLLFEQSRPYEERRSSLTVIVIGILCCLALVITCLLALFTWGPLIAPYIEHPGYRMAFSLICGSVLYFGLRSLILHISDMVDRV